jgi:hypothetical protein
VGNPGEREAEHACVLSSSIGTPKHQDGVTKAVAAVPISTRWHEQIGHPTVTGGNLDRLDHNARRTGSHASKSPVLRRNQL